MQLIPFFRQADLQSRTSLEGTNGIDPQFDQQIVLQPLDRP